MKHHRSERIHPRREVLQTLALAGAAYVARPLDLLYGSSSAAGEADLAIAHGRDIKAATRAAVSALGGMRRFISRGDIVLVKPNIGWPRVPAQGSNTHPEVVASIVDQCFEAGAKIVKVADRSLDLPERCYRRSGIAQAVRQSGGLVEIVDASQFRVVPMQGEVMREWPVYVGAIEVDKRINVPVAKHHTLCGMTAAMKNWFGMLGADRDRLHRQIHVTVTDMAQFFRPHLTVLDATRVMLRNGPQGGSLADVQAMDVVAASRDQVAIDAFAATLIGLRATDVEYLALGQARGLGEMRLEKLRIARIG